jgi:uncharacterized protein YidB (DUF937 family)
VKTIKQIADELGVSKEAIRKRLPMLPPTTLTRTANGTIQINADGETVLRSSLPTKPPTEPPTIDNLIAVLQRELDAKNKLIDEQQQTINRLTETLQAQADGIAAAQQNTQAAQLLHADTKGLLPTGSGTEAPVSVPDGFIARVMWAWNQPRRSH